MDKIERAIEIFTTNMPRIQILSDFADKEYCGEALNTLIDLATSLKEIQAEFPEEVERKKPTIKELEEILEQEGQGKIYIKPDGSIIGGKPEDVYLQGHREGFNEALALCTKIQVKREATLQARIKKLKEIKDERHSR